MLLFAVPPAQQCPWAAFLSLSSPKSCFDRSHREHPSWWLQQEKCSSRRMCLSTCIWHSGVSVCAPSEPYHGHFSSRLDTRVSLAPAAGCCPVGVWSLKQSPPECRVAGTAHLHPGMRRDIRQVLSGGSKMGPTAPLKNK